MKNKTKNNNNDENNGKIDETKMLKKSNNIKYN